MFFLVLRGDHILTTLAFIWERVRDIYIKLICPLFFVNQ